MLVDIIKRYQSYDPTSGRFAAERGLREYARHIGVNSGQLSQIINGIQKPGLTVVHRLAQTFPAAADGIANALKQPAEVA